MVTRWSSPLLKGARSFAMSGSRAVKKAQLSGVTFHTLRHSFVAIWSPPDATCERFLNGPAAAAWRLL